MQRRRPPENDPAPLGSASEAEVPSYSPQAQDTTFVAREADPRKPLSPRDLVDRDLTFLACAALRVVRLLVRFVSPDQRDRIADEAGKTADECQRQADQPMTRADLVFDKLMVALDDRRGRR